MVASLISLPLYQPQSALMWALRWVALALTSSSALATASNVVIA